MFRASFVLSLIGALAASAAADDSPVPEPVAPAGCQVDLVRVPDDVRPVIEEWVAAETRCAVRLAIRVFRTDDGLYVMATDDAGGVRERLVPDALTAAVLIASWVADDGTATPRPAPGATPAPDAIAPAPTPEAPAVAPVAAPGMTPAPSPALTPAGPGAIGAETGPAGGAVASRGERVIGVGWLFDQRGLGARLDVQWRRVWRVELGASASFFRSERDVYINASGWNQGMLRGSDASLFAQASVGWRFRRIELRGSVGVGATLARAEAEWMESGFYHSHEAGGLSPAGEIGLTGAYWIGRWAIRGGVVTAVTGHFDDGMVSWERGIEPRGFVGVGRAW